MLLLIELGRKVGEGSDGAVPEGGGAEEGALPEGGGAEEGAVDGELVLLPGAQVQGQGQVGRVAGGEGGGGGAAWY